MSKINLIIKPFTEIYLNQLLSIRNKKFNRKPSLQTKKISKEENLRWFKKLNNLQKNFYYIIIFKNKVIGCIYIKKINVEKINYLWGFYTKPNLQIDKLGSSLKYNLFEIVFNKLGIKKIYCEVKNGYEWIADWHIRWGHTIVEKKKNKYILEINRNKWITIKKKIKKKLNKDIKINLEL